MRKVLLCVLVAAWAVAAVGCAGDGGKSATEKEFQKLYKEYSARFHEKMVGTAETMRPILITAEAARIWDEVFGARKDLLNRRVAEVLSRLDEAAPYNEDLYLEIASGSRKEPSEDQPQGIVLKQFVWSPIGAAQMELSNFLARLLRARSFGVRSLLSANAGLFWTAVDRSIDKPKLQQRQGPMIFEVELTRVDDYYQVEKVRWLRPKSMGPFPVAKPPEGTTPATPGEKPPEKPAEKPAEKPPAKPIG